MYQNYKISLMDNLLPSGEEAPATQTTVPAAENLSDSAAQHNNDSGPSVPLNTEPERPVAPEIGMGVPTGMETLDPRLFADIRHQLQQVNAHRQDRLEACVGCRPSDAWHIIRSASDVTGPKLTVSTHAQQMAASVMSKMEQEFVEPKHLGWDERMKEDQLRKYVWNKRMKLEAKVLTAAAEDLPMGLHTSGHHAGAELLLGAMGMPVDVQGMTIELRPETFLEGIDSELTIATWRDHAKWQRNQKWQMQSQLRVGPWSSLGLEHLLFLYGIAWGGCLNADEPRVIQVYTGEAQTTTALKMLKKVYEFEVDFTITDPLTEEEAAEDGLPERAEDEWWQEGLSQFRTLVGFEEDTDDIRLSYKPGTTFRSGTDLATYGTLVWEVRKVRVRLDKTSQAERIPSMPQIDVDEALGDSKHTFPHILTFALEAARSTRAFLGSNGAGRMKIHDVSVVTASAQVFRYWADKWRGTTCLTRALVTASFRCIISPDPVGSEAADSARVVDGAGLNDPSLAKSRGTKARGKWALFGANPFRICPARIHVQRTAASPYAVWCVENKQIVQHDDMAPFFPMEPAALKTAVTRVSMMLTLYTDQVLARLGLSNDLSYVGVGWKNCPTYGSPELMETVTHVEQLYCQSWFSQWSGVTGYTLDPRAIPPFAIETGWRALQVDDEVRGVQRIPTWAHGLYFSVPYVPSRPNPPLGDSVLIKANSGAPADMIGSWFRYPVVADGAVFSTAKGTLEDYAHTPYPVALVVDGKYVPAVALPIVELIDSHPDLTAARVHNRGIFTIPTRLIGNNNEAAIMAVVKARRPPQSGGLASISCNALPTWVADAPSTRSIVDGSVSSDILGLANFRL